MRPEEVKNLFMVIADHENTRFIVHLPSSIHGTLRAHSPRKVRSCLSLSRALTEDVKQKSAFNRASTRGGTHGS
jgi:hypothetical protein